MVMSEFSTDEKNVTKFLADLLSNKWLFVSVHESYFRDKSG